MMLPSTSHRHSVMNMQQTLTLSCYYFENNVPFDNTAPIYLINLLWKLWLGFRLEPELHYLAFLTENKESEHLIFREFHAQ